MISHSLAVSLANSYPSVSTEPAAPSFSRWWDHPENEPHETPRLIPLIMYAEQMLDSRAGTRNASSGIRATYLSLKNFILKDRFRTRGTCRSRFFHRWRPTQNYSPAPSRFPYLAVKNSTFFQFSAWRNSCTFKSFSFLFSGPSPISFKHRV